MARRNAVIEAIRTRRSVRGYQPGPVPREDLETIVDCARLAPCGMNEQTWEFVVVTDNDDLEELARLAPDNGPFIADAMACIVVVGKADNRNVYLDGAAATENMLLAIHSLGYASCWVQAMNKPYCDPIRKLLGVPDGMVLCAMVPVGVAFGEPDPLPKRALEDVLHWGRY